jgi:HAD superfamily hydrolase (TIGR01509 family)
MKAVIFDMDGVIIDSEPLHFQSNKAILEKFKVEVPDGYFDAFVGVTNPVMWKKIIAEFDIDSGLDEILNLQLSMKLKLLKKGDFEAIDGIPELLQELYIQDIPAGVASSSSSMFIKEVIKKLRLEKYIAVWVSGENVERSKPEPDVFLKTAELLQVSPEKCVVIEDSRNGVLAARKAGMKCIGFKNANSGNQDLTKADLVVDSIHGISLKSMAALFVRK